MPEARIVSLHVSELPGDVLGCRKCQAPDGYLARYVKADRRIAIRWVCDHCEDYGTAGDLPHSILPAGVVIHDLPKRVDHSHVGLPGDCAVCGTGTNQNHHWAPVEIFPHWPRTLTVWLCQQHHNEWHKRMRACGLRWPGELAR